MLADHIPKLKLRTLGGLNRTKIIKGKNEREVIMYLCTSALLWPFLKYREYNIDPAFQTKMSKNQIVLQINALYLIFTFLSIRGFNFTNTGTSTDFVYACFKAPS